MVLGAHLPASKGFEAALQRAAELDCTCLQLFSKTPRQWNAAPLDAEKAASFRTAWKLAGAFPLVIHDSYLINLAAHDDAIREKSVAAMIDEVERAEMLGADFLVTHCGAHLGAGEDAGLVQLRESLLRVLAATPEAKVRIALENTAAQGTCLGGPFSHLARVLEEVNSPRLAVCFDTCHAFAAGHDVRDEDSVATTLGAFEDIIGLQHLEVVHLNDSKGDIGKHLDRHEHIGLGKIGEAGMRALLRAPQLRNLPFILETPELETHLETNLNAARALRIAN
jgi:deoxyribonuclease-4